MCCSMESGKSGVVYIGHLPHGFYEEELKGYFSQFGSINKVRVARNKKTGHAKGYAFIEFACDEVAKIAAQTMNNYLMFNKLLKCHFVEPALVHPGMLGGKYCLHRKISLALRQSRSRKLHNKGQTPHQYQRRVKRLLQREKKTRKRLTDLGISYNFPGYGSCVPKSVSSHHIKYEE